MDEPQQKSNALMVPGAIIVAGALVALSIIYTNSGMPSGGTAGNLPQGTGKDAGAATLDNMKAVSAEDHILGNPEAPVKLVEFSDLECPFCKSFHKTVQQMVDEYGKQGKVAFVYRHFPLDQLHSQARTEAEATECAGELGGNEKFFAFIDGIFAVTPSNDGLDLTLIPKMAAGLGLNEADFNACWKSGRYADKIEAQYQDAISSGGNGTPFSIVVAANGKKFPISGALPYTSLKATIEKALAEK